MMTVGIGRTKVADMFHSVGTSYLAEMIPLTGSRVWGHVPVKGGIGVFESMEFNGNGELLYKISKLSIEHYYFLPMV